MTYEELVLSKKPIGNMNNDELITYCNGLLEEVWDYEKATNKIVDQLRKIKNDLDFEPWSIYQVDGNILFDLLDILKGSDEDEKN